MENVKKAISAITMKSKSMIHKKGHECDEVFEVAGHTINLRYDEAADAYFVNEIGEFGIYTNEITDAVEVELN